MFFGLILTAFSVLASFGLGYWIGKMGLAGGERYEDDEDLEGDHVLHSVGSPVQGNILGSSGGECPEIWIEPVGERIYAPVSGKVIKLFPMGNEFMFLTEFGAQLHIRVGEILDDLQGRFFRPKILQNEIVEKGKLLLEFDRKALEAEGFVPDVGICLKERRYGGKVRMMEKSVVRTGEEILQIWEEL
jgi:phosphotransferase system IIA component